MKKIHDVCYRIFCIITIGIMRIMNYKTDDELIKIINEKMKEEN